MVTAVRWLATPRGLRGPLARPSILALLVAAALLACGGAPPPGPHASPEPTVLHIPSSSAAAPAAPPAEADPVQPLPPPVALPAPAACVLEGPWQPRGDTTPLRLGEGGPVFANVVNDADTRLHLAAGRPGSAGLEIEAGQVALRAHVDADAIPIRPARAVAFQEFVVPLEATLLEISAVEPGHLTVGLGAVPGVEGARWPLVERLRCDQVTAGVIAFDATQAVGDPGGDRQGLLRLGRPIPLSVEPGGPPVASLRPEDDDDADVMIVGTAGPRSRVLWWREDALIFGWVPTADLRRKPTPGGELGQGFGFGGLGMLGTGRDPEEVTCPAELPLVAEVGGKRATVGAARAGSVIEIVARGEPYARVMPELGSVMLAEEAALLARAADLARCERHKRK